MAQYSYEQRRRENSAKRQEIIRKRKLRRAIVLGMMAFALVVIISIIVLLVKFFSGGSDNKVADNQNPAATPEIKGTIEDNVYIEDVMVGGMEFEEALEAVDAYSQGFNDKTVNVYLGQKSISASLSELGFSFDAGQAVAEAFEKEEAGKIDMDIEIDETMLRDFLENNSEKFSKKSKNASIKRSNGEFIVGKSKTGRALDVDNTIAAVNDALQQLKSAEFVDVEAAVTKIQPEYSTKTMSKINDVLGKFSTTFSEGQVDRSANVRNAVSFIDGTVLYPGEEFSVAGAIYPLSADNGYRDAPSYAGGQVVDSLGGGVCQVSTTLYNAALRAELKITDRSPHSMMVTYVKPSMDAAIAGDYKDLKFVNNQEVPIYIQGYAQGGIITFTIYGDETRPSSRSVDYYSEVVETIEPGKDKVTKDPTQPEGYEKVTQSAHVGYVANLYKIIYENGVEKSREKINNSRYKASPRYVIVGTKKEKPEKDKKDPDKNKNKNNNNSDDKSSDTQTQPTEQQPTEQTPSEPQQPVEEAPTEAPPEV